MSIRRRSPFARRDFRLLWLGEAVSTLGDQFAMIALPWLALLLTGSTLALGSVLALMAVPRAVLIVVGGAYVDRLSPRLVMLGSNAVRLVAVGAIGGIVLADAAELWMLYVFALVFGVADAFFYPAQTAIVPELVDDDGLQQANGIVQGTAQLSTLVGPALAGVAIASLAATGSSASFDGVGLALLIDAATFLVSLVTLLLITPRSIEHVSEGSFVQQIAEGIRFVWRQPALRLVMGLSMAANLLIVGPIEVGVPLLAYARLPEGAAAFGFIVAAFGAGSLAGLVAATVLPSLPPARFGSLIIIFVGASGVWLAGLAFAISTPVAMVLAALMGVSLGYTNVCFLTWIQRRIPRQLMGRVMSFMTFGSIALIPISMFLAGILAAFSLDGLLIGGGVGMATITVVALASSDIRRMGLLPTVNEIATVEPADNGSDDPAVARSTP